MYITLRLMALIIMMLSVQTAIAAEEVDITEAQGSKDAQVVNLPPVYPEWPERVSRADFVPAPPLGPYMSTGLQRGAQGFACCEKNESGEGDVASLENAQWPMRRRPPRRWQPAGGEYSYAPGEDSTGVSGSELQAGYGYQPLPQPMRPPVYQWGPQGGYR